MYYGFGCLSVIVATILGPPLLYLLNFLSPEQTATGLSFGIVVLIVAIILYVWGDQESKRVDRERENELSRQQEWESRRERLKGDNNYEILVKFSRRYGVRGSQEDIEHLRLLLDIAGHDFTKEELYSLVIDEHRVQSLTDLERRIMQGSPQTLDSYIKTYLEIKGESETLEELELLLKKSGYIAEDDQLTDLSKLLEINKKELKLERFSTRLELEGPRVNLEEIDQQTGYDFEEFLKELFKQMGYVVEHTRLSGDQGADLVVVKLGEKTVVQAKRYNGKVGNWAVQEIVASMRIYDAHKGMVVTNSYFTKQASELAKANNIELVDREQLRRLIEKYS